MDDIIREFLLETHENLAQLDLDLVTLEKDPGEKETLARVFRTIHTVKGTTGFLGLVKLQAVAHAGEHLLSRLRSGELALDPEIATALLAVVDAIRTILAALEASQTEGSGDYTELVRTLERLADPKSREASRPKSAVMAEPTAAAPTPAPIPAPAPAPAPVPAPEPAPPPAPVPVMVESEAPSVSVAIAPAAVEAMIPAPTTTTTPAEPPSGVTQPEPLPEPGEARASAVSDSSIRVDVGLLDKLMTLVGELVLARNQILQYSTSQEDAAFLETAQRLNLLTTELQAGVMKTRMQPIGNIWSKFPRIVRDMALACEKQVRIDMDGQETELDKTIIEAIRDPLTHMVRNAVDHGIEPPATRVASGKPAEGRLRLHAFHEGGKVIIEITDDGAGIDPGRVRDKALHAGLITAEQAARMGDRELIHLIFHPGFSTTDRVTHFSGRGVGMDVVRTNVEKIGGTVDIESRPGLGSTIKMKIPLTLAIIPALTVTTGGDRYAIPQVSLLELVRLDGERAARAIERVHGAPVYRLRGRLLPLVYLDRVLQVESNRAPEGEVFIVVLQADDRRFGLVVDDIHDTEEIVVKPLQKQLKGIAELAGATIMGDGRVALILDVVGLAQRAKVVSGDRGRGLSGPEAEAARTAADRQTVLLFAAPDGGPMAVPLALVARLEEFPRSAIERVGGRDVVQYRGEILPLIHVERALRRLRPAEPGANGHAGRRRRPPAPPADAPADESVPVVVFHVGGRRVGLVVGRILDIVDEAISGRAGGGRPGVLFAAVVQGRVTEFLDVERVLGTGEAAPRALTAPGRVEG